MDRNLHDDYFERFLRESVEEFRMIPSRRVWTSLYNNLHPGKNGLRWLFASFNILRGLYRFVSFIGERYIDRQYHHKQQ